MGVSRVVNPYCPYRLNGPLSIRTRSENCLSLRGLRIFFTVCQCEGGFTGCRSVRSVQIEWAAFDPYTIGKLHIIRVLRIFFTVYRCEGGFTVCRFVRFVQIEWAALDPYTIGKLHLIKGTWNIFLSLPV